jgi:hypothetical protein
VSLLPIIDLEYRLTPAIGRSRRSGYSLWQPTFFTSYTFCHLRIYDYNVIGRDTAGNPVQIFRDKEYAVVGHRAAVGVEFNVKSNTLGLGLYWDRTNSTERVGGAGQRLTAYYFYPQFYYFRNSFNKRYFPTQGSVINARVRLLNALHRNVPGEERFINTFGTYYIDAKYALPLSKRLTIYPSFMIAGTYVFDRRDIFSGDISEQQQFYQGGLFRIPHINQTPFVGLYFMQKVGLYGTNVQVSSQYELFRNFFLTARIGVLKSENDIDAMLDLRRTTFGAGLSASFNTTVGPVGLTRQRSSESPASWFINLGFWL